MVLKVEISEILSSNQDFLLLKQLSKQLDHKVRAMLPRGVQKNKNVESYLILTVFPFHYHIIWGIPKKI